MANESQYTSAPSLAVLLGDIANDAKELLDQEVAMLKLEARDELRKAKSAAIALGIGIGIVAAGGMLLSVMLVQVLAVVTKIPLWGCYGIVGSGLVVLGGVWLAVGKTNAETLVGIPQQVVETRKETAPGEYRANDRRQNITAETYPDIEDTRAAMTEKLELLGERVQETVEGAQASVEEMVETVRDTVDTTVAAVKQTVEGAQASVEDIVENVKDTVDTTVETVQRTFDLHHQMEQRPWLLLSGSLFVGYLLGSGGSGGTAAVGSAPDARLSPASPLPVSSSESPTRPLRQQGITRSVRDRFTDEIALIEGAVIGAVISTLGDMVKQALLARSSLPPQRHEHAGSSV